MYTQGDNTFIVTIPSYQSKKQTIFYNIIIQNLHSGNNLNFIYRYKQLKQMHQSLLSFQCILPQFPKSHWPIKTNNDPQKIQKRRGKLQKYLNGIINDPILRAYPQVEVFLDQKKMVGAENRKLVQVGQSKTQ